MRDVAVSCLSATDSGTLTRWGNTWRYVNSSTLPNYYRLTHLSDKRNSGIDKIDIISPDASSTGIDREDLSMDLSTLSVETDGFFGTFKILTHSTTLSQLDTDESNKSHWVTDDTKYDSYGFGNNGEFVILMESDEDEILNVNYGLQYGSVKMSYKIKDDDSTSATIDTYIHILPYSVIGVRDSLVITETDNTNIELTLLNAITTNDTRIWGSQPREIRWIMDVISSGTVRNGDDTIVTNVTLNGESIDTSNVTIDTISHSGTWTWGTTKTIGLTLSRATESDYYSVSFTLESNNTNIGGNSRLIRHTFTIYVNPIDTVVKNLTATEDLTVLGSIVSDITGNVVGNLIGDVTGDVTGNIIGNVTGDLTGDVTGDVTGNLTGDVIGDLTGNVTGDVTGNLTGDITGNVIGNVTGDVTGDLTGNVTGDLTGNVTGDVTGNLTGNVAGNVIGDVTGNVTGDVTGNLAGNVTGDVIGDLTGDVTGNLTGNVVGNVTGDVAGDLTGNVTGNVSGDVTGNLIGNVIGNVIGNLTGDLIGNVTGNLIGSVTGNVDGNLTGNVTGDVTGDVTGNLTGNVTGNLTGNVTGDVTGNVTGQASDISNHDTDSLAEGSTNLYYTSTRAREAISVTNDSGDGTIAYDNSTGVITYTGPSASEIRSHLNGGTGVSITDGEISIGQSVDTTDDVTFSTITATTETVETLNVTGNAIITGSLNIGGTTTEIDVDRIVTQDPIMTLGNHDVSDLLDRGIEFKYGSGETDRGFIGYKRSGDDNGKFVLLTGATNASEVITGTKGSLVADIVGNISGQASTVASLSGLDTDGLTEGSTNLYYTDTRARASISLTDSGGDGSLTYNDETGAFVYTGPSASEVRAHISGGTGVTISNGEISIGQAIGTTDDVTFGTVTADVTGNLTGNVIGDLTGDVTGNITGNINGDITGNITGNVIGQVSDISNHTTDGLLEGITNLYYTDTRARASISLTDSGGDGSLTYDDETGAFVYTGPSASEVRAHISGGTGVTITDGAITIGQSVGTTDDVTFNSVIANIDGIVGGTTPAAVTGTTITANTGFVGDITGNLTGTISTATQNLITTMTGLTDIGTDGVTTALAGDATIAGTFGVTGATTLTGNLTANGTNILDNVTISNNATVQGNMSINGNLTVSGTTTQIDVDQVTTDDPIIKLSDGSTETAKDRGIEFNYGSDTLTGFMGYQQSTGKFIVMTSATNDTETLTGTTGTIVANIEGDVTGNLTGTVNAAIQNAITTMTGLTTIGTDSVTTALLGDATIAGTLAVTGGITGDVTGNLTGIVTGDVTGNLTGTVNTATQNVITTMAGLTSIGTDSVTTALLGDVTIAGTLGVTGDITGNLTGIVTGDVTGNLTGTVNTAIQNAITTMTGLTTIGTDGVTTALLGDVTIAGTLEVTETITGDVTGNLNGIVTGDVTGNLTGDVIGDVTGDVTGNLTGTVNTTTQNVITTMAGLTSIGTDSITTALLGDATIAGTLGVTGAITGDVTGNLTGNVTGTISTITQNVITTMAGLTTIGTENITTALLGDATIAGTLGVTGTITGDITGNLTGDVTGNLTGTSVTTTNLDFTNGTMKGHLIPDTDNSYDIGTAQKRIRDLYVSSNTIVMGDSFMKIDSDNGLTVQSRDTSTLPPVLTTFGLVDDSLDYDAETVGAEILAYANANKSELGISGDDLTQISQLPMHTFNVWVDYLYTTWTADGFDTSDLGGNATTRANQFIAYVDDADNNVNIGNLRVHDIFRTNESGDFRESVSFADTVKLTGNQSIAGTKTFSNIATTKLSLGSNDALEYVETDSNIDLTTSTYSTHIYVIVKNTGASAIQVTYNMDLTEFIGEYDTYIDFNNWNATIGDNFDPSAYDFDEIPDNDYVINVAVGETKTFVRVMFEPVPVWNHN
jgi:hypothetical protein